jgi:DNA polymerase mu
MRSSSLSSDSADERTRKRVRSSSLDPWDTGNKLRIYIVQAKIEEKNLFELYHLIESSQAPFELSSDFADADVIITNIRMKKRLERHIPWDVAVRLITCYPSHSEYGMRRNKLPL